MEKNKITITIGGDFGYRGRVAQYIETGRGDDLFKEISSILKESQLSILNLECPVGDPRYYIKKAGPSICCTEKAISTIRNIGFNMVTLANNHFFDCGQYGVEHTINTLNKVGLYYVGGGISQEESKHIKILKIGDTEVSFINICETEFSISTPTHGGANQLDPTKLFRDIIAAKASSKHVIVIIHGGHEFFQLPSPRMQDLYRFCIELGATAVINHHQHCFSGYELYKHRPIFYGLGNLCFDSFNSQHETMWNNGYLVQLILPTNSSKEIEYKIIPYKQCVKEPGVHLMTEQQRIEFEKELNHLNEIIKQPEELKKFHDNYLKSHNLELIFQPLYNGKTASIYKKKWFPSLIGKKQLRLILNYLQCESHREIILNNLRNKCL